MEQEKRKFTLKDLLEMKKADNVIFSSLFGDNNDNYNLFRIVREPNAPVLTQRIYE